MSLHPSASRRNRRQPAVDPTRDSRAANLGRDEYLSAIYFRPIRVFDVEQEVADRAANRLHITDRVTVRDAFRLQYLAASGDRALLPMEHSVCERTNKKRHARCFRYISGLAE